MRDEDGNIMSTPANVQLLFVDHFVAKGRLRRNVRGDYMQCRDLPWDPCDEWREWTQDDYGHAVVWLQTEYSIIVPAHSIMGPIKTASSVNAADPFVEYLESVDDWDGTPRLDFWLTSAFGGEATLYSKAASRCSVLQTVARAAQPGCKAELKLVLVGVQGKLRKSTGLATLVGREFFNDNLGDKKESRVDELMRLHRCVWHEDQEMSGYSKREVTTDKAHISTPSDLYRSPYDDSPRLHPRRFLECATHNPIDGIGFLRDSTGGRRYLPFVCTTASDRDWIANHRDQIWAEALHRYNAHTVGEDLGPDQVTQWWLTDEEEDAAQLVQAEHTERDPWSDILQLELSKPVRPNAVADMQHGKGPLRTPAWGEYNRLVERDCDPSQLTARCLTTVTTGQALAILGIENPDRAQQTRVAEALKAAGCVFDGRKRVGRLGKVSLYTVPKPATEE